MLRALLSCAILVAVGCSGEPATTTPAPTPIALVAWVTDLSMQTTDEATPDTVEDKVIADTDDAAAFDSFLVTP